MAGGSEEDSSNCHAPQVRMKNNVLEELKQLAFAIDHTEKVFVSEAAVRQWDASVSLMARAGGALRVRDISLAQTMLEEAWAFLASAEAAHRRSKTKPHHTN